MVLFSIHTSIDNGFAVFFGWIPRVLGFLAVLLIGYLVAKTVAKLISGATHRAGLDRALHGGTGGDFIKRTVPKPSGLLGRIAFWAIFLGALSIAASVLGIAALTAFIGAVWAYIPNVIAALLIFIVAGAVSAGVVAVVQRVMGDTSLGKIVAAAAPILVMTIATFMILEQLQIAPSIVRMTYAALLGSIALAAALAFGLGGREVAGRMLEGAYSSAQDNKEQMKRDLQQGRDNAKQQVEQAKADGRAPASSLSGS